MKSLLLTVFLSTFTALSMAQAADGEFVSLFDGKTLQGWDVHTGKAQFRVDDGCIVGKPVLNTENSFLCTKKKYGDFILEFQFKVSAEMNSGVQFRSEFFRRDTTEEIDRKPHKYPADRVFGYQFEIDPTARGLTGAVYDEARRGIFLDDLQKSPAAREAYKAGEWNAGRIECRGNSIKTWINGVPAADLQDGMSKRGLIGLQVHSIGNNAQKLSDEVRWRNLQIKELR